MIRYTMRAAGTRLLGPGERCVLWVHGCSRNCSGCIARDMNNTTMYSEISPSELLAWFAASGAEGITLSGGEPFEQAEELLCFLRLLKEAKPDATVIVYTGNTLEMLLRHGSESQRAMALMSDVIIDGEYEQARDTGAFAVGSANQRVIAMSDRIPDSVLEAYYFSGKKRAVEIRIHQQEAQLIGVPDTYQLTLWKKLKEDAHETDSVQRQDA